MGRIWKIISPSSRRMANGFCFSAINLSHPRVCVIELTAGDAQPACREIRGDLGSTTWALDSHGILFSNAGSLWWIEPDAGFSRPMAKLFDGVFSGLTTDIAGGRYAYNRIHLTL